jgi:hypothetical protein
MTDLAFLQLSQILDGFGAFLSSAVMTSYWEIIKLEILMP